MQDKIEKFGNGSILQHGRLNNRVYLMKLKNEDCAGIIDYINNLALNNAYTKIFCKVPGWAVPVFISNGFIIEAQIPKFYNSKKDVFFMSKFLNSDRLLGIEYEKLKELSELLQTVKPNLKFKKLKSGYNIKKLDSKQVIQIVNVYKEVFASYPFPIHNPDYILSTMKDNIQYYGVERKKEIVALSSAEIDKKGENAEMTDFATLKGHRGKKLSVWLLKEMEKSMKKQGIKTLYTIARLNSIAMNKTFLNHGYKYAGTLINNTNIAGKIESMNVMYKYV